MWGIGVAFGNIHAEITETDMRVIDDVNLDQLVIGRDGKTLRLEFIDMYQGAPVGVLECRDVILLNYNNCDSEGFAAYVAAVDICELQPPETWDKLRELGCGVLCDFSRPLDREDRKEDEGKIFHAHLESGEILVDICCGDCWLTGSGWPEHSKIFWRT